MLEYIYTSAPETFDGPGYGAVAKSDRFPSDLEKFIRKLCRYDFISNGSDTATTVHPNVYSHVIYRDASGQSHVISRIGFAGLDYTRRSVFLAHHVVLTDDELGQLRVGELLRQPDLFRSSWEGAPKLLPPKIVQIRSASAPIASHWKQAAGDQQWSRVWAQKWLSSRTQPRFLVLPAQLDPLPLFLESLASLTSDQAAQTTFITHLASDHRGPTYEWIGLIANSELAVSIERNSSDRVLNLTRPLGSPAQALAELNRIEAKRDEKIAIPKSQSPPPEADQFLLDCMLDKHPSSQARSNAVISASDRPDADAAGYRVQSTSARTKSNSPQLRNDSLPEIPVPSAPDTGNLQKYVIIAGILAVFCIGIVVWMVRKPPDTSKSNPPTTGLGADSKAGDPDSKKSGEGSSPKPDSADDPSGKTPGSNGVKLLGYDDEVRGPKKPRVDSVKFVTNRLKKTMQDAKDKPGKLTDSVRELKRPGLRVSLVSSLGLKGKVTTDLGLPGVTPEIPAIEIKVTQGEQPIAVTLQIQEGAVWLMPSSNSESDTNKLLDRLRFSVLDIESSASDPEPFLIQLGFNPRLSSVPTNGLTIEDRSFKANDDVFEFFEALNQQQSTEPMNCFLRINRISLSMLPGGDSGWPIAEPNAIKPDFQTPLKQEIRFKNSGAEIVGSFRFETHFDFEDTTKPVVAAELLFAARDEQVQNVGANVSPSNGQPALTSPEKSGSGKSDDEKKDSSRNDKGTTDKKTPKKKATNKKTSNAEKPNQQVDGAADGPGANDADAAKSMNGPGDDQPFPIEQLPNLPDRVVLDELFRRFGRVHAEFVIRIPRDGNAWKLSIGNDGSIKGDRGPLGEKNANKELREIVILRFGE